MADLVVVYWRDIPARVIARAGPDVQVKLELSPRFAEAIDIAARKGSGGDADAGLAEWRKADPIDISDELQAEARGMARWIEDQYDDARLKALARNGGREG